MSFCLRRYTLMSDGPALRSGADLRRIELAGSGSDRLVAALLQHEAPPGALSAEAEQTEQLWALVRNTGARKVLAGSIAASSRPACMQCALPYTCRTSCLAAYNAQGAQFVYQEKYKDDMCCPHTSKKTHVDALRCAKRPLAAP